MMILEAIMPSLHSLTFDTSALSFDHEDADRKVWFTGNGDGISLYFIDERPTLPLDMKSDQEVHAFYLSMLKETPAKLLELNITSVGGCPAVRLIIKSPQKPSGFMYLGSITIPFRDFSYVVNCQCPERGMTGVREAILFDEMRRTDGISIDSSGKITGNWNPDVAEHDAGFPQHPLSRLRKVLGVIEATGVIEPETRNHPGFPLPE
jgi:hypothetical protein